MIKDPNFRIQVSDKGIHLYNRDGHFVEKDPFAFFPKIKLEEDGSHAFRNHLYPSCSQEYENRSTI